ncbi:hypothetical protein KI387_018750, partial [Taxus chinensis]
IVATNTEVHGEVERETSGLKFNREKSLRKEELCMLRQDPENELSDLRYCMELKLEPDTTEKGPFEHFKQYFNWLKLDVVNSVIPGDSVGPLGVQLTYGVSSKHVPKKDKHETVEGQLANTDYVIMLMKEIFGYIAVDCNNFKSAQCLRNYRTLLLDTVLVDSGGTSALLQLLSRSPFDSFMVSPVWTQFDGLMGFWHEHMFYCLDKSQVCQYIPLASLNAQEGDPLCHITSVFPLTLVKRPDLWHQHSTTQWLTKRFSFLLNHEERQGLSITYCEIGAQKPHSANENMLGSAKSDSLSEVPQDCNADLPAELEMLDLQRMLIGKGAHRHLSSFMRFKYHRKPSSALHHQFCEIVMMERLQSGVFVDPFELQRLVNRGALNAAYVYGDANLELPSQRSHQSIVELHATIYIDSGTSSQNYFELELKVDLPLHARYPVFITGAYISERELKLMSDALNISSVSEKIPRSAPIAKNADRIKSTRVAQTKIASTMIKRDEREGSTKPCIASRFVDIGDTNLGPEPLSELIGRFKAGKTSLMRAVKSSGIIRASTFPVTT